MLTCSTSTSGDTSAEPSPSSLNVGAYEKFNGAASMISFRSFMNSL